MLLVRVFSKLQQEQRTTRCSCTACTADTTGNWGYLSCCPVPPDSWASAPYSIEFSASSSGCCVVVHWVVRSGRVRSGPNSWRICLRQAVAPPVLVLAAWEAQPNLSDLPQEAAAGDYVPPGSHTSNQWSDSPAHTPCIAHKHDGMRRCGCHGLASCVYLQCVLRRIGCTQGCLGRSRSCSTAVQCTM